MVINIQHYFVPLVFVCLIASCSNDANTLKPFASDGCSAFPDGTLENQQLWLSCCVAHDFEYWRGGDYAERQQSDLKLQQCVADIGQGEVAKLMLAGVRVGGSPYWPTQFRWGYGWPYFKGYGKLTNAEIELVRKMSENYKQTLPANNVE